MCLMYRDLGYRRVHKNPNDVLMALLLLGSAGTILWYMQQQGLLKLPEGIFPTPGTPGGGQPAEKPCFDIAPGNTSLTLQVTPWNPQKQINAPVSFFGQLKATDVGNLNGQVIEFWDNKVCQPFDSAVTNEQGVYSISRPLQPEELEGYSMFAVYRTPVANLSQAITGVIHIKPGA